MGTVSAINGRGAVPIINDAKVSSTTEPTFRRESEISANRPERSFGHAARTAGRDARTCTSLAPPRRI